MALRLRRGTNAQRLGITFAEGELVYTTDTKKLYIGDASAAGGNLVSGMNNVVEDATPQLGGNLDLNGNNITGTGNINITGTLSISTGFLKTDIQGSVFADDSGILVDSIAGKLVLANNALGDLGNVAATVPTDGQVLKWNNSASQWQPQADSTGTQLLNTLTDVNAGSPQNLQALVWDSGTSKWIAGDVVQQGEFLDGDFRGSLFADDSTLLIDSILGHIQGPIKSPIVEAFDNTSNPRLRVTGTDYGDLVFTRGNGTGDLRTGASNAYGQIKFAANDASGTAYNVYIQGGNKGLKLFLLEDFSTFDTNKSFIFQNDGKFGVGTQTPIAKLDVQGEIMFGSFTDTQRDALTAADGMIIYNSSTNKFQGRANGAWVNLH